MSLTNVFIGTAVLGVAISGAIAATTDSNATRVPILLELFTSEGCSRCPPADRLLQDLDDKQPIKGAQLVVLSEQVDYWNGLGWRDPYSSPQFSTRQQDYSNKYDFAGVYTPQLVVDGRVGLVGSDAKGTAAAIQKVLREPKLPMSLSQVARQGSSISAKLELAPAARTGSAILYVALADNRAESQVSRGENSGRRLAHVAVTRVLRQVGTVSLQEPLSKEVSLTVPQGAGAYGLRLVAFLQDPRNGHILAVAERKL